MKYEDFVRRQKTSAYAFDEDLMKANGECSLLSKKSILKTLFWNVTSFRKINYWNFFEKK